MFYNHYTEKIIALENEILELKKNQKELMEILNEKSPLMKEVVQYNKLKNFIANFFLIVIGLQIVAEFFKSYKTNN